MSFSRIKCANFATGIDAAAMRFIGGTACVIAAVFSAGLCRVEANQLNVRRRARLQRHRFAENNDLIVIDANSATRRSVWRRQHADHHYAADCRCLASQDAPPCSIVFTISRYHDGNDIGVFTAQNLNAATSAPPLAPLSPFEGRFLGSQLSATDCCRSRDIAV